MEGLQDSHDGLRSRLTVFSDKYFWKEGVDHAETHWLRFQEAVKAHERFGLELLGPLFAKMGIDLRRT